jgi:hypothetical protein
MALKRLTSCPASAAMTDHFLLNRSVSVEIKYKQKQLLKDKNHEPLFSKNILCISWYFWHFRNFYLAKSILIPIGMALLISFILFPVSKKMESGALIKSRQQFCPYYYYFLFLQEV